MTKLREKAYAEFLITRLINDSKHDDCCFKLHTSNHPNLAVTLLWETADVQNQNFKDKLIQLSPNPDESDFFARVTQIHRLTWLHNNTTLSYIQIGNLDFSSLAKPDIFANLDTETWEILKLNLQHHVHTISAFSQPYETPLLAQVLKDRDNTLLPIQLQQIVQLQRGIANQETLWKRYWHQALSITSYRILDITYISKDRGGYFLKHINPIKIVPYDTDYTKKNRKKNTKDAIGAIDDAQIGREFAGFINDATNEHESFGDALGVIKYVNAGPTSLISTIDAYKDAKALRKNPKSFGKYNNITRTTGGIAKTGMQIGKEFVEAGSGAETALGTGSSITGVATSSLKLASTGWKLNKLKQTKNINAIRTIEKALFCFAQTQNYKHIKDHIDKDTVNYGKQKSGWLSHGGYGALHSSDEFASNDSIQTKEFSHGRFAGIQDNGDPRPLHMIQEYQELQNEMDQLFAQFPALKMLFGMCIQYIIRHNEHLQRQLMANLANDGLSLGIAVTGLVILTTATGGIATLVVAGTSAVAGGIYSGGQAIYKFNQLDESQTHLNDFIDYATQELKDKDEDGLDLINTLHTLSRKCHSIKHKSGPSIGDFAKIAAIYTMMWLDELEMILPHHYQQQRGWQFLADFNQALKAAYGKGDDILILPWEPASFTEQILKISR